MIAPEVLQQEFGVSKCRDSVVRDRATPKAPQRGFLFVMPFLPYVFLQTPLRSYN